jgi:hypothetical protein
MFNFKKITLALALAAASAVGTPALAAVQTVDAVGYTFSFDDVLWGLAGGTTFSSAGDVFTFANLGYATRSASPRSGQADSGFYDLLDSAITVTAKSGYQLTGIVTGAIGEVSAVSGSHAGSLASAYAFGGVDWVTDASGFVPTGAPGADVFAGAGSSDVRGFNNSDAVAFVSGTTFAVGTYLVSAGTKSFMAGSSAFASLDSATFSVGVSAVAPVLPVSPVPEPESFALLLSGLALVAAVARRRRIQG